MVPTGLKVTWEGCTLKRKTKGSPRFRVWWGQKFILHCAERYADVCAVMCIACAPLHSALVFEENNNLITLQDILKYKIFSSKFEFQVCFRFRDTYYPPHSPRCSHGWSNISTCLNYQQLSLGAALELSVKNHQNPL